MTRTLGRDEVFGPLPPSKYSIRREVCDLLESSPFVAVLTVIGLPSSGIEYEVRSVRLEIFVARSVCISSPDGCNIVDSVGAGRGIFLPTPIAVLNNYREVMSKRAFFLIDRVKGSHPARGTPCAYKKKQRISLTMIETVGDMLLG